MISFVNDPNELKGRRALVTGGSRGIGGAIVRRLLSAGARVVAVARHPGEDFPADAAFIQGDVSSLAGVQAIVEQTSATSTTWIFWSTMQHRGGFIPVVH